MRFKCAIQPFAIVAILGMAFLQANCAATGRPPRAATNGAPTLSVATFNVNLGLAGDPETMAAIRGTGADVVFLQEVTPAWELGIRTTMRDDFPHMGFRHCCRAGGLAVLSRFPFEDDGTCYISAPTGWFPGWRVEVDSPLGPVQVLQVHLHPPVSESGSWGSGYFTTDDERLTEIEHFVTALKPDMPTMVLGDFNEENGEASAFLRKRGFVDAVAEFNPGKETWRWPTSLIDLEFSLDHIFYDQRLEPLRSDILELGRSDHFPIRAIFELAPQGANT
ncbi:MAG: endonuclease/exonuclease/phosphatase family protein [Inquilinus sp.]|nr:endonuclease/exonuclease/phosphatase family protein [Inquilinus sp.]